MSKGFKILLIIFVIVLVVCGIVYFNTDVEKEEKQEEKQITNNDLLKMESKIPKGLIVQDEKVSINEGKLSVNASIYNKGEKRDLKRVEIIIQNSKGELISDFIIQINSTIKKDRFINLSAEDSVSYSGNDLKTKYIFE